MPRYVDYATCGCFAKARQLRFSYTASEGIAVLFTQLKKICLQEQMDWAKYWICTTTWRSFFCDDPVDDPRYKSISTMHVQNAVYFPPFAQSNHKTSKYISKGPWQKQYHDRCR